MKRNNSISTLIILSTLIVVPQISQSQQLMSVIKSHNNISSFATALESQGLDKKLNGKGPFTVFAPTNESFDKEVAGKSLSSSSVHKIVMNHIMTGYATERNIKIMSKATSLGGIILLLETDDDGLKINDARVTTVNIKAQNGVLHIISGILK